jgi:ABC-type amino acid transport substrate-binding protein
MSKGTQLWPGERMQAFFRAHIRRETSLDDEAAERLANALTRATNRMLIWDAEPPGASAIAAASQSPPGPRADLASSLIPQTEPEAPAVSAFNPYAFSAMVVLARKGRDGLAARLAEIKTAADLKVFAEAQHLAVDPKLKKIDDLRKAIITATEQRLADRKAAAS